MRVLCSEDAQKRLTVQAGTWKSIPDSSTAMRPML